MGKKKDLFGKLEEELRKISNQTAAAAIAVKNEVEKQTSGGTGKTPQKTSEKTTAKQSNVITPTTRQTTPRSVDAWTWREPSSEDQERVKRQKSQITPTAITYQERQRVKEIQEDPRRVQAVTPTAITAQERQQVKEYNDSRTKVPAVVQMPTLTQRMELFGNPFAALKIRDATMPTASATMSTAEKPKSTDAWTWRELSSKDKAATSTAKKASPMRLKGDETPELVESKMRSLQSEQAAYKTYLELLGKNMGDHPTEKQAEAYLKVAALYQDTGKVAGEYISYLKECYTPEACQKRIEDMQAQLEMAEKAANPAQFVDPGRTSYLQRADMDAAKERAEELAVQIKREEKRKALLEYEALRQNPDFEENSAYKTTANGKEPHMIYSTGKYDETGYNDILYDALNGDKTANERILNTDIRKYKDVSESTLKLFNYIYNHTKDKKAAYQYLDLAAEKVYTGAEAIGLGAYEGTGLWSLTETLGGAVGDEEYKAFLKDFDADMATAQRQHPTAYGVGRVGGTLALMGGIGTGVGAIPGFSSLSPAAQTVISHVAARGGTTAIQGLGDAVSGQREWGAYAADVFTDSFAGAASGGMSYAIGTAGANFLNAHGLTENVLARSVVAATSGLGASVSNTAVTEGMAYLRDPEGYEFDAGQAFEDALVNVAFSVIGNLTKNYTTDPATAAQMDADDALVDKYFKGMTPEEAKKEYHRLARANHPDHFYGAPQATKAEEAMKEINRAWNAYTDRIKASGTSAYQVAEAAKASGDTAAYKRATADFVDSVNGLQAIVETGGIAKVEVADALQILNAVSTRMQSSLPAAGAPTLPRTGVMPSGANSKNAIVQSAETQDAALLEKLTMEVKKAAGQDGKPALQKVTDGGTISTKTGTGGSGKRPRLSKQEWRQVQAAQMQKYGGIEESDIPESGYVFAHDHFYIIRNYGSGAFDVQARFDPVRDTEAVSEAIRRFKDEDGEEFRRIDWEGHAKRSWDTGRRSGRSFDTRDGGERPEVLRLVQGTEAGPDTAGVLREGRGDLGALGGGLSGATPKTEEEIKALYQQGLMKIAQAEEAAKAMPLLKRYMLALPEDGGLKQRGLGDRVAEAMQKDLKERGRAEEESKPLRERVEQELQKKKSDSATGSGKEEFTKSSRSATSKLSKAPGTIVMPNYTKAVTPMEKFIQYSLNYENPKALGKPESYKRGLGYTKENAKGLVEQIHTAVASGRVKAFAIQATEYGVKYRYRIAVTGPNGKTKNVIAVYQINHGDTTPRMVTNYLEGK